MPFSDQMFKSLFFFEDDVTCDETLMTIFSQSDVSDAV